jgi:hypothetical protein
MPMMLIVRILALRVQARYRLWKIPLSCEICPGHSGVAAINCKVDRSETDDA